jgi:hypothetical protein
VNNEKLSQFDDSMDRVIIFHVFTKHIGYLWGGEGGQLGSEGKVLRLRLVSWKAKGAW